jgi:Fe-S cluster assembly scaffold protein SufB
MLEFRLKAFRKWLTMDEPRWSDNSYPSFDYQGISYYSEPKIKEQKKSLDEVRTNTLTYAHTQARAHTHLPPPRTSCVMPWRASTPPQLQGEWQSKEGAIVPIIPVSYLNECVLQRTQAAS